MNMTSSSRSLLYRFHGICSIALMLSTVSLHAQRIGEVNGTKIGTTEYEERVREMIDIQRQRGDAQIDESLVREGVWNQMVAEILIRQGADRLGIRITDEEFQQILLYDPPDFLKPQFTDSAGVFQLALYQSFMNDIEGFLAERGVPAAEAKRVARQVDKVKAAFREDLLRQAVDSAVTRPATPSPADSVASGENQHGTVTFHGWLYREREHAIIKDYRKGKGTTRRSRRLPSKAR